MIYSKIKSPAGTYYIKLNNIYFHKQSKYQEILVADTHFGKTLFLDDELQSSQQDQEAYHKALILPYTPLEHESVLIIGAGEGILINKLLQANWKNVTAIELDKDVIEACKFLDNDNIYNRLNEYTLIIDNAFSWLKSNKQMFSYIILDLNTSAMTNLAEWFSEIKEHLIPNGVLSWQDGAYDQESLGLILAKTIFNENVDLTLSVGWRFGHVAFRKNRKIYLP